ncbi:MAG: hypothetical protein ACE5G8_13630, partial [Anaerolineae bacterium]
HDEQLAILHELISDAQFDIEALVRDLGRLQKTLDVLQVKILAFEHANAAVPEHLTAARQEAQSAFAQKQTELEERRRTVDIYEDYRDSLLA